MLTMLKCINPFVKTRGSDKMQDSVQKLASSKPFILHCLGIIGGALVYSLGINLFIVPAGLYSGGVMGISQLLRTFFLQLSGLTLKIDIAGLINYAINLVLLCIAWKKLDRRAVFKTLLCVTSTTIFLSLLPREDILSGDTLAECLIGGVLCGCGVGIILWMGGTAGGMDLIGMMLLKKGSHTSIGHVNLLCNLILYAICAAAFNLPTAIYSVLYSFISTTAMDKLHMQNINVEVTVVTKILSSEMEQEILVDLHRGITRYEGVGEYTGQPVHIFYILVNKYEISRLRAIVRRHDPHAFIVAKDGAVVYGNYKRKV